MNDYTIRIIDTGQITSLRFKKINKFMSLRVIIYQGQAATPSVGPWIKV